MRSRSKVTRHVYQEAECKRNTRPFCLTRLNWFYILMLNMRGSIRNLSVKTSVNELTGGNWFELINERMMTMSVSHLTLRIWAQKL